MERELNYDGQEQCEGEEINNNNNSRCEVKLKSLHPVLFNQTSMSQWCVSHCATWESQETADMIFKRRIKWEDKLKKTSKKRNISRCSGGSIVSLKRRRSKDLELIATQEVTHCNEVEQTSNLLRGDSLSETDVPPLQRLQPETNLQNSKKSYTGQKNMKCNTGQKSMKCYVCGKLISKQVDVSSNKQTDSKSYICKVCQPKSKRPMLHTSNKVASLNSSGNINVNSSAHNNVQKSSGHNAHNNIVNSSGHKPNQTKSNYNLVQQKSLHEDGNNLICNVCRKQSSCRSKHLQHYLVHFRQIVYICEFCGREFTLPQPLKTHILFAHTGKDKQCEICNQQFDVSQRLELNQHLFSHNGQKKFMCEICLAEFGNEKDAKNHVICHIQKRDTECGICHRQCENFSGLKKHLNAHEGRGLFTCKLCQELFYHHDEMEKHILNDHIKNDISSWCRTTYINK